MTTFHAVVRIDQQAAQIFSSMRNMCNPKRSRRTSTTPEPQLIALARKYFLAHDRMSGTPTPS